MGTISPKALVRSFPMHSRPILSIAAVLSLLARLGLNATILPVTNSSFESQSVPPGFVVLSIPTGWSAYNPANLNGLSDAVGLLNPTGTAHFPGGAAEGSNVALVFLDGPATGEAGLQQMLAPVLESNLRYTLSVEIGNIASGTANFGFFNLAGFPGYRVDLLAGSTVVASDSNSLSGGIPEGEFRTSQVSLMVGPDHPALGESLGIRLVNLNLAGLPGAPGVEVNFDDVRLTAVAVPEPANLGSIIAAGLALVAWGGRLKR